MAIRLAGEADSLIETLAKGKQADGRLDSIYTVVWDYTLATVARDSVRDALELGQALRGEPLREPERLPELAEAYRRAAEANLDTIDVVVIPGLAEDWGVSAEEALTTLRQSDVNYAEADAAVSAIDYLRNSLEPGPSRDFAVLGAALVAYAGSAAPWLSGTRSQRSTTTTAISPAMGTRRRWPTTSISPRDVPAS